MIEGITEEPFDKEAVFHRSWKPVSSAPFWVDVTMECSDMHRVIIPGQGVGMMRNRYEDVLFD